MSTSLSLPIAFTGRASDEASGRASHVDSESRAGAAFAASSTAWVDSL
jgi:hypothetical protein